MPIDLSGLPHGYDPKVLKFLAAKQIAALSVNTTQYDEALAIVDALGGLRGVRVVTRARDAVDYASNQYLPRIANDAQASKVTTDLEGMRKYLLGRNLEEHQDYIGLDGPTNGTDEVELEINEGVWINARTGQVTQTPDSEPVSLKPNVEGVTPIS